MKGVVELLVFHVRYSFYKILCVLVVMVAAEWVSLQRIFRVEPVQMAEGIYQSMTVSFSSVCRHWWMPGIFLVALLATTFFLWYGEQEKGRKRKSEISIATNVSYRMRVVVGVLYNLTCYILLLGVQLAVICSAYLAFKELNQLSGGLDAGLYEVFIQNEFLCKLFPLETPLRMLANGLWFVAMSVVLWVTVNQMPSGMAKAFIIFELLMGRKHLFLPGNSLKRTIYSAAGDWILLIIQVVFLIIMLILCREDVEHTEDAFDNTESSAT